MSSPPNLSPLQPASQECFDEYAELVMVASSKLRAIRDYHSVAEGAGQEVLKQEAVRLLENLTPALGRRLKLFGRNLPSHLQGELVLTEQIAKEYANIRAEERVPTAIGIHDAAAIVFAHSVFEGIVHDFFTLDFRCNYQSWDAKFARRSVEYQQARQLDEIALREVMWQKERREIERETSLQDNVNDLLGRCGNRRQSDYTALRERYKLDVGSVADIDVLRQSLIHRPPAPAPINDAEGRLATILHMMALIAHCCGVCLFDLPVEGIGLESIVIKR